MRVSGVPSRARAETGETGKKREGGLNPQGKEGVKAWPSGVYQESD